MWSASIDAIFNLPSLGRMIFSHMLRSSAWARTAFRGRCSSLVAFPDILQCRRYAVSVALAHRIAAAIDLLLEFFGRGPSGLNRPIGIRADGKAALSAFHAIVQQEGFRAARRDAQGKPLDVGVPKHGLAARGSELFADAAFVRRSAIGFPCQHCVNNLSCKICRRAASYSSG